MDGGGTARGVSGDYADASADADSPHSFWPTTIDFSAPGCWLVTETSGRATLRFLMRVNC